VEVVLAINWPRSTGALLGYYVGRILLLPSYTSSEKFRVLIDLWRCFKQRFITECTKAVEVRRDIFQAVCIPVAMAASKAEYSRNLCWKYFAIET
jgi:hypothetical protein